MSLPLYSSQHPTTTHISAGALTYLTNKMSVAGDHTAKAENAEVATGTAMDAGTVISLHPIHANPSSLAQKLEWDSKAKKTEASLS